MPDSDSSRGSGRLAGVLRRVFLPLPGIALCVVISLVALSAEHVERSVFAHPYVEALVIAIVGGAVVRAVWIPSELWQYGIAFSAKQLLEIAVILLGASISYAALAAAGPILLVSILAIVVVMLLVSFGLGRVLGLSTKLAVLIACGNSICGNSAIAAVAPVIEANSDDIAASISFTAILGVLMVLGLPLLMPLFGLSATQYGILAGLTVYAVPQVLAATLPFGIVSTQIGTLVKLVRVLMLGPVVIGLSILFSRNRSATSGATMKTVGIFKLVPWFIIGFSVLAVLRSFQIIPDGMVAPMVKPAAFLTIVSMAALGLSVDTRVLANVGGKVTAVVTLSLLLLLAISVAIVHLFD